jgi:hypothetical protein
MKNEDIKYIISPNNEIIIGAPNDINWDGATAFEDGDDILIASKSNFFNISNIGNYPEIENIIRSRKSFVLSYINKKELVLSRIQIESP